MKSFLLVCAFVAAAASAQAESLKWGTDYKAALAQAKEQNRHVLLFFTGSDWCIWCKRLNQEILSKPEFAQYAAEKLVLVELDFPQRKSQSGKVKAQNAKLQDQYKIESYPTVIVLDRTGQQVGQLGYQEGGPAPFIAALSKF